MEGAPQHAKGKAEHNTARYIDPHEHRGRIIDSASDTVKSVKFGLTRDQQGQLPCPVKEDGRLTDSVFLLNQKGDLKVNLVELSALAHRERLGKVTLYLEVSQSSTGQLPMKLDLSLIRHLFIV